MLSFRLEKAIRVAAKAHRNQKRKGSDIPYIIHPYSVMLIAKEVTDDEDTLIACLFHDIIEDVPDEYSEVHMRQEFGDRAADIVLGVTKDSSLKDWQERSEAYMNHLEHQASDESVVVSASDKIHNLMSMLSDYEEIGEQLWDKFHSKKDKQLWFYQSVGKVIRKRLPDSPLCDQLDNLIKKLEQIVNR